MPIANYSTSVPATKTVGEIQVLLATAGARSIMMDFDDDHRVSAVSFIAQTKHGDLSFRLPADVNAVLAVMEAEGLQNRFCTQEHAERVAWRILKDWVRAQMALIEVEMVTLEEVFLPYMLANDGKHTLYEVMVEKGFYLPEGRGEK